MNSKISNKTSIQKLEKIQAQRAKGKLMAMERIVYLKDLGSKFNEINQYVSHRCYNFSMHENKIEGDGVITGFCNINNKPVITFSQDFTAHGGSLGEAHANKICKAIDLAIENEIPLVGINDSGGARIQEGVNSLAGYGAVFYRNVKASGFIPQISLIMGPCAGGASYSPALTDFIIMNKNTSYMFVTGANVIKKVTFESVTSKDLGGAKIHAEKTGLADIVCDNELESILATRKLLEYLPQSRNSTPKRKMNFEDGDSNCQLLDNIIPSNYKKSYDMKHIISSILDFGTFLEIKKDFAKNIIVGYGRIYGHVVGIVANQPSVMAGCINVDASCKAARFIRFCNSFNIPIVSLVDVPGFLPGKEQEHGGIVKHGSKLISAYAGSTVPKITVITRKSYGGAYIVMGSSHLGADIVFAWPKAEIAVMGADGAAEILFAKKTSDPRTLEKLTQQYKEKIMNPYESAERGYIQDIILPSTTRSKIGNALNLTSKNIINRKFTSISGDNIAL